MIDCGIEEHSWDCHWMSEAYLWARKSKDRRTQVGAVIVGEDHDDCTRGYNGPLRGLPDDDPSIYEKPAEGGPSIFMEHAERNAINNAARRGVSIKGCRIWVNLHPCDGCARAIVNAGLKEVILHAEAPRRFNLAQQRGGIILDRAGIPVRYWSGTPLIDRILYNGEVILTGYNNAHL